PRRVHPKSPHRSASTHRAPQNRRRNAARSNRDLRASRGTSRPETPRQAPPILALAQALPDRGKADEDIKRALYPRAELADEVEPAGESPDVKPGQQDRPQRHDVEPRNLEPGRAARYRWLRSQQAG